MKKSIKALISVFVLITVLSSTVNVVSAITYWESPVRAVSMINGTTVTLLAEGKCYNSTQSEYILYGKTTSKKAYVSIAVNVGIKYEDKRNGKIVEVWDCSPATVPPLANTSVSTRSYVSRNDNIIPRDTKKLSARATYIANSCRVEYEGAWKF